MLEGCYYRCPIEMEEGDRAYPRFFVLAQLVEYNELADTVRMKLHDLLHSGAYYGGLLRRTVFRARDIARCEAVPGGAAEGPWGRGVILARGEGPEDQPFWYWIRLPDGRCVRVQETKLRLEYSQMNYAPEKQLRAYEFQHPTWFINRCRVSRNRHMVQSAAYGFSILAGCRAFLLPHQVSTVVRCLETLPVRYMLADEVGLGKTVEACSILRILAEENRGLRTLIVVPGALAGQWRTELRYKFGLEARVGAAAAPVCLLPMEELEGAEEILDGGWDLAIVDETHRLLDRAPWYGRVQELSRRTPHLLLLSATPIQDRNEEYRRLLALLSPEQYGAMAPERFAWLVEKQKRIQRLVNQQLNRLGRYEDYREDIGEKLEDISRLLQDRAFTAQVEAVDPAAPDRGLEQVRQALAYLCENYRVERRVVRGRRQLIQGRMARRVLREVPYTPLTLNEDYNESGVIQSTLAYLAEYGADGEDFAVRTAIPLLSALFSSPWAFEEALSAWKIGDSVLLASAAAWKRQADNEHRLADVALDEDPELIKGRLLSALNYIDQETDMPVREDCKLVVFTAWGPTLRAFLDLFNARYAPMGIYAAAFARGLDREALEESVYAFQNDPACRAIVCDETGGEGRNFQNAAQIIHLDLPWSANTLEQRIGRLDRLGRDPDTDIVSVVLYAQNTVEEQLFRIWRDGMKLFDQSLSGLEIVTGELNRLIARALEEDYATGLANAFEGILDQAREMRESVEDEQDFDLGAALYRPLVRGVDRMLEAYEADSGALFTRAMLGWGSQAGLRAEESEDGALVEFRERGFSANAARQSLFIPPDWDRYENCAILCREGKLLGSFDRKTAAMREDILFFAPGDAVYDAILSNASGCSRGRCAAIGVGGTFDYDGVIYIYNVEPWIEGLLEEEIGLRALAQYRMYLPLEQIIVPVGLTRESREVPEGEVIETLMGLTERRAEHLGRRSAGRMSTSALERFITRNPPERWEPLVEDCSAAAFRRAAARLREQADLEGAAREMRRVLHGLRAERAYFRRDMGPVEEQERVFQRTLEALKRARPVLDAVCFLRVRKYE